MENATREASSKPAAPASGAGGFWRHLLLIAFVAVYFGGLLFWFGRLFVTGGTEEHAVMALVIPVVTLLGLVAVVGLSLIAFEGRRAALGRGSSRRGADSPTSQGERK